MVFMIGIYWCARSPETDRMKIRARREGFLDGSWEEFASDALLAAVALEGLVELECWIWDLLMWVRARVRAPAMDVVGVREEAWVSL